MKYYTSFLLFLFLSLQSSVTCLTSGEETALEALAHYTLFPSYTGINPWNQTFDKCEWFGVYCSGANSSDSVVMNLNLQFTTLLPTEIGLFQNLTSLNILDYVRGSLPTQIGKLKVLSKLYINAPLSGTFPTQVGLMSNLASLTIRNSVFDGTLPSYLGSLTSLTSLLLNNNSRLVPLPTEIGSFTSLQSIQLEKNLLTSIPTQIGNLANMETLVLENISGTLPTQIGKLTNLRTLFIYNSPITGSLPNTLGSMRNLVTIMFISTDITGSIPSQIANLQNLVSVNMFGTKFSECYPQTLSAERSCLLNQISFSCECPSPCQSAQPCYLSVKNKTVTINKDSSPVVYSDVDIDTNGRLQVQSSITVTQLRSGKDSILNLSRDATLTTQQLLLEGGQIYLAAGNGTRIAVTNNATLAGDLLLDFNPVTDDSTVSVMTFASRTGQFNSITLTGQYKDCARIQPSYRRSDMILMLDLDPCSASPFLAISSILALLIVFFYSF